MSPFLVFFHFHIYPASSHKSGNFRHSINSPGYTETYNAGITPRASQSLSKADIAFPDLPQKSASWTFSLAYHMKKQPLPALLHNYRAANFLHSRPAFHNQNYQPHSFLIFLPFQLLSFLPITLPDHFPVYQEYSSSSFYFLLFL